MQTRAQHILCAQCTLCNVYKNRRARNTHCSSRPTIRRHRQLHTHLPSLTAVVECCCWTYPAHFFGWLFFGIEVYSGNEKPQIILATVKSEAMLPKMICTGKGWLPKKKTNNFSVRIIVGTAGIRCWTIYFLFNWLKIIFSSIERIRWHRICCLRVRSSIRLLSSILRAHCSSKSGRTTSLFLTSQLIGFPSKEDVNAYVHVY